MRLYHFQRLIRKYGNPFVVEIAPEPAYEGGEPVAAEPVRVECEGAILPVEARKLYQSGGTLTASDRQLYTLAPLPGDVRRLAVVYQGQRYAVEQEADYGDFADVVSYVLKGEGDVAAGGDQPGDHGGAEAGRRVRDRQE